MTRAATVRERNTPFGSLVCVCAYLSLCKLLPVIVHVSKCQSLSLSVVRRSVTGVLTGQNKTNTQTSGLKSETALANTSKSLFILVSSLVGEQCSLFLRTYYFLRLTNRKQPWLSIQIKFRQSIQMKRVYNILALTGAVSDFRQIQKKKRKH